MCLPDIHEQGLAPRPASNAAFDPFSALVAAPAALLEDAVERARSRLTPHLLGDGRLLGGLAELRAGIADRLTADGLATNREQVIITNGAMGALSAMLDATRGPVLVDNLVILVDDEPPEGEPELLGLYEGVPLTERDSGWAAGALPDRIAIFRGPLTRWCADEAELREEIAVTVVHELAHHFGIDDQQLHAWGWG